jgi:hypothetical protein
VDELARRIAHAFDALAEHVRAGSPAPLLGTPTLLVGTSLRVAAAPEALRLVDRQCLLLVRVHDRIATLPRA